MNYFPENIFCDSPAHYSFVAHWYREQLIGLKEPSIYAMRTDCTMHIYRFLWLRSFHHPVAVRFILLDDGGTIISKMCDGAGGYEPGNLILNASKVLSISDKNCFISIMDSIGFWDMPSFDADHGGLDGSRWILEGLKEGKYHLIDRWTPASGPVRDLGLFFLGLGNIQGEKIY
jgi:hypothetical protein